MFIDSRTQNTDRACFENLVLQNKMVLTPNRCYDDLVLIQLAARTDGVVVSRDQFRDVLFKIKDFTPGDTLFLFAYFALEWHLNINVKFILRI